MDEKFVIFIKKHHVLTLAANTSETIWCANCFYAFDAAKLELIFTSDDSTKHVELMKINPQVAGSIVLETRIVGKIQGIQFQGKVQKPEGEDYEKAKWIYLKRFPFAALMTTNIWTLKLTYMKLTDNQLGFGKKLIWEAL